MSGEFLPEGTLRGLPGPLPQGERVLWRGAPGVEGTLTRIFHARIVAAWFALGALVVAANADGAGGALFHAGVTLAIGAAGLGLLALLAWLVNRTTVYTVTNRRVVLHAGIALPVTLNLPYAQIDEAGLRVFADGSGDIPLRLRPGVRVAYLQLWPHARPWRVTGPEPMLRSVPEAAAVARVLAQAFAAHRDGATDGAPVRVRRAEAGLAPGRLIAAE